MGWQEGYMLTNFMSHNVQTFCTAEGIEIVQSPVNDHRATGCVERTIGSLKNSILTYALSQADEPTAISIQGQGGDEAGPSRTLYQRTGDRNLSRYRKLNSKIVAESTHTLKMKHAILLRKSGVAVRKASTPKKLTSEIPKPPTPADLRKKIAIADSKKRGKLGTLEKQGGAILIGEQALQESESDSDSQPLATRRIGGKLPSAQCPRYRQNRAKDAMRSCAKDDP